MPKYMLYLFKFLRLRFPTLIKPGLTLTMGRACSDSGGVGF
jgi:hypothetical protein